MLLDSTNLLIALNTTPITEYCRFGNYFAFTAQKGSEMSLTITLEDELSEQLEREAMLRQVSAVELAGNLLSEAVALNSARWSERNQRRLSLIRKSLRESLTSVEQRQLDELQASLDVRFQDFDEQLLHQLDVVRSALPSAVDVADE